MMIVRPAADGLHLITQPDHAALARRIMDRWQRLATEPRRDVILYAIEQHDNGWRELDDAPLVDPASNRLADFIHVEATYRQGVWPRGVERAAARHPWAGALIAHHAATVYGRFRQAPAWKRFFEQMEASRARLVARSGLTMAALEGDYFYLRIGDLASLLFCTADREGDYSGVRLTLSGDRLTVTPDPFGGATFDIAVAARVLPDRGFASNDALRDACRTAPGITLRGVVTGASG